MSLKLELDLISHYVPYQPKTSFGKEEEQSVLIRTAIDKKISIVKVRIQCKIFLSEYFMKHSLMHISLHIIDFMKFL